jgi:hypothetical protein
MLRGLKGVTRANASYPDRKVAIGFDGNLTSEKALKELIATCGFSVAQWSGSEIGSQTPGNPSGVEKHFKLVQVLP